MTSIAFICVAAIATLIRALVTSGQHDVALPWRTLAINTIGAFVLGVMIGAELGDQVVWTAAGLGSLTTFSTVAAEAATLLDRGDRKNAAAYVSLTLVAGVLAAYIGLILGEAT